MTKPLKIDFNEAVGLLQQKDDDDFMRMLIKVRNSNGFISLPSWMEEIPLDLHMEPSHYDVAVCYAKLVRLRHLKYVNHHPANVVDDISMTKPMTLSVKEAAYKDDDGKVHTFANYKGFLVETPGTTNICAASTATILSYFVRGGKEQDLNERVKNEPANLQLGFDYAPGLTMMRSQLQAYGSSSSETRDMIYHTLTSEDNRGVNYYYSAMLATKFPKAYKENKELTVELEKYYDEHRVPKGNRLKGSVMFGYVPKLAKTDNIEIMWRFLNMSRAVRGQDSAGCGTLTIGYYLGMELSRSFVKNLSMAWDIMNVLDRVGMRTVQMHSFFLPAAVMNFLVHNGYYVVITVSTYPVCKKDDRPGLYSATCMDTIHFYDYKLSEPVIKSSGITYVEFPVVAATTQYFSYAYMSPSLALRNDIGFFPTMLPHQGRVIVTNATSSEDMESFVARCVAANYFRNGFVLHRRGFWRQDSMSNYLNVDRVLTIPSAASVKVGKGSLTSIIYEEPHVVKEKEDGIIRLLVDPKPMKPQEYKTMLNSWLKSLEQGSLMGDVKYLEQGHGSPSTLLKVLIENYSGGDLMKWAGDACQRSRAPEEPTQKEIETIIKVETEGKSEGELTEEVNKKTLQEIKLDDDDFS